MTMGHIISKLRIGEKTGFKFGLVGLLFLTVIFQYHNTLQSTRAGLDTLRG